MANDMVVIVANIMLAWRSGDRNIRQVILAGIGLILLAGTLVLVGKTVVKGDNPLDIIATALFTLGVSLLAIIAGLQERKKLEKQEKRLELAEKRIQENPHETQAAWELAQAKLEVYLNRNLGQIRTIFWLTLLAMGVGFSLIVFGVAQIYTNPAGLNAAALSAVSGIIVSFIGATFLVLYKSTMTQAASYVGILERINAVGMSVQILDTLKQESGGLRDKATVDIAKQLLIMYSTGTGR